MPVPPASTTDGEAAPHTRGSARSSRCVSDTAFLLRWLAARGVRLLTFLTSYSFAVEVVGPCENTHLSARGPKASASGDACHHRRPFTFHRCSRRLTPPRPPGRPSTG